MKEEITMETLLVIVLLALLGGCALMALLMKLLGYRRPGKGRYRLPCAVLALGLWGCLASTQAKAEESDAGNHVLAGAATEEVSMEVRVAVLFGVTLGLGVAVFYALQVQLEPLSEARALGQRRRGVRSMPNAECRMTNAGTADWEKSAQRVPATNVMAAGKGSDNQLYDRGGDPV